MDLVEVKIKMANKILNIITNFRIRMLEGNLASVDENIKIAKMATEAEKVAQDGRNPTREYLAQERRSLYADRFKLVNQLNALAYQT